MSGVTLGPYCADAGLTEQVLRTNNSLPQLHGSSRLRNGLLYELGLYRRKQNISWSGFKEWIEQLCEGFLPYIVFNESNLRISAERLIRKVGEMKRNKKDWQVFLDLPFNVPVSKSSILESKASTKKELPSDLQRREQELSDREYELHSTEDVLKDMKQENKSLVQKLSVEKRKRRNIYKQLKRRDTNIESQKQQISSLSDALSDEKKKCESGEKLRRKAVQAKEKYRSKANYYSRKKVAEAKNTNARLYDRLNDIQGEFGNIVDDLKQSLKVKDSAYEALLIENEQLLEEQAEASTVVSTFDYQTGAFKDAVRQCCMELLSLNVGARNIEPIIRSVMRDIGGLSVERLPQYTTLINMLSEMKVLACAQLAEELSCSEQTTLHSDGTTKFNQHYGSFQISTEKSSYTLGLMEMSSGSAKHTLDCLKNVLSDINMSTNSNAGDKILTEIKNTMSDRHVVEKSFNNLLEDYRLEILPTVVENWEDLSDDEKTSISSLNSFFCGMHLVVGMADTAAATVKEWENAHFDSLQGAASLPKVYAKNESGMCCM